MTEGTCLAPSPTRCTGNRVICSSRTATTRPSTTEPWIPGPGHGIALDLPLWDEKIASLPSCTLGMDHREICRLATFIPEWNFHLGTSRQGTCRPGTCRSVISYRPEIRVVRCCRLVKSPESLLGMEPGTYQLLFYLPETRMEGQKAVI